jgi:hypothetical protein
MLSRGAMQTVVVDDDQTIATGDAMWRFLNSDHEFLSSDEAESDVE